MTLQDNIDQTRRAAGYLTIAELVEGIGSRNTIFDPQSTLISARCIIGSGNVFYPCSQLTALNAGSIIIGDDNIFHSLSNFHAEAGSIKVGDGNQFGEGGVFVKANRPGADITIGDRGRYNGGATIVGPCQLGTGSQILGAVRLEDCTLCAGEDFTHHDPDRRAGLAKGTGVAKTITVKPGCVAVLNGRSEPVEIQRQSIFHPKR